MVKRRANDRGSDYKGPYLLLEDRGDVTPDWRNPKHFRLALEALLKIHSKNVVHGDIRRQNFRWLNGKVYFLDFGEFLS